MSGISPGGAAGDRNPIWEVFNQAGRPPDAQPVRDDPLQALFGGTHGFSGVQFDPAALMSQRLATLTPARLHQLREAVEGEAAAVRGAIVQGPLDPPATADRALQRARLAQLGVLERWIDLSVESRLSGWMAQQFIDMRSCEREWDFHTLQADLAQALHDYLQDGDHGPGSPSARALDATVERVEMTVLTRMCHAFEHRFITGWIGNDTGGPDDARAMAALFHDSIMLLDGILMIRDAANCYPPAAAGGSGILPAGAAGSRGPAERLPRDLKAATGLAQMREQVFAHHPALTTFAQTVIEIRQGFRTDLPPSPASETALEQAHRLFHVLKTPYELYADAIRTVVGRDPTESPIVADYSRRDPTSEFAGRIAVPPETVMARLDGAVALLKQADARLAGARAEATDALERLRAAHGRHLAAVKEYGPPLGPERAMDVTAIGALNTLHNEARRLVDGLAFTPRPIETPGAYAAVLPAAAVAMTLEGFSVARREESAEERRVRAAENFLDMRNDSGPEAPELDMLDRFFVKRGPCAMTLPDSV